MFYDINYEDINEDKLNGNYLLIDVRSPIEYSEASIPNSVNIPIFSNEERALIGTTYKQDNKGKAKEIGVDIVSKKLPNIYKKVSHLNQEYKSLVFLCSRGGYRSGSLVSFFKSLGINALKLKNGYKGYRKYISQYLPEITKNIHFIVLYGNTGTDKTHILEALQNKGMDVLDLEACANHRGSILGGVGLGDQNSQKMFESLVFESLEKRKTNYVFVEGESKRIGKDIIPQYLFDSMTKGINLKISANIENRIKNIMRDYIHDTDDELVDSLNYFRKYMGNKNVDRYIEQINQHQYKPVIIDLITKYYDPLYENNKRDYSSTFINKDADITASNIMDWFKVNAPNP